MHNSACKLNPPCALQEGDPLSRLTVLGWDGPAKGRKAVSYPGGSTEGDIPAGAVYLDQQWWDSLTDYNGRKAILFHELGHLAGARCEPCADFYAGWALRRDGAATDRDAKRTLLSKLENRSEGEAAMNLGRGFGADEDPLAGKPTKTVDGYSEGNRFDLEVVEFVPGHWAEVNTARAWLRANAEFGGGAGVESAFRFMADQQRLHGGYAAYKADPAHAPHFNPADPPGYSKHQSGTAIDGKFATDTDRERFAAIAAKYGFTRPFLSGATPEPWHFRFDGAPSPLSTVAGVPIVPLLALVVGAGILAALS